MSIIRQDAWSAMISQAPEILAGGQSFKDEGFTL
jgi:hypothetical protein